MSYEELVTDITSLSTLENVDFFIVGYSTMGQPIYGMHLGSYEGKQELIEGAIHAREYFVTPLLCRIVRYLSEQEFSGGIYVLPLVNPDGVRLVLDGVDWIKCAATRNYLLNVNNGQTDFSQWKANALAVDLNVNFDALWGTGTQNVFCPSSGNFVGYYPNSERETRLLIDFAYSVQPNITLSFHTKGEVIFYGFDTLTADELNRDKNIAESISKINGYAVTKTEGSVGGFSDWVSLYLGVPAFTIEVGPISAPTPVPLEYLDTAFEENKDVPITALNALI
ncbi:MAG: hypothetical protein J6V40_06145 [Clostridia bacterium]|nr:hypothetical protein [Clostridia bacterium]